MSTQRTTARCVPRPESPAGRYRAQLVEFQEGVELELQRDPRWLRVLLVLALGLLSACTFIGLGTVLASAWRWLSH